MMNFLVKVAHSKLWWLALLVLAAAMIGVALYYQHVMAEWPCVLCIHVRILFLFLMLISAVALAVNRLASMHPFMHALVIVDAGFLINRSWELLATERGWTEGVCSIELGMPAWFAIDKWLPDIFSAWTTCGYTPVLAFGVTMAEALLIFSVLLLLASVSLFIAVLRKR